MPLRHQQILKKYRRTSEQEGQLSLVVGGLSDKNKIEI
jgi:hypothetical protein